MKLVAALAALTALTACSRAESQGGEGHSGGLTLEQKLPTRFAQLSNVIELGNGRVAFADTTAKLFLTADLRSGKVDTLGTRVDSLIQGAPATQDKFPGWVAHLAGDTVALVDFSGLRTDLFGQVLQIEVLYVAPAREVEHDQSGGPQDCRQRRPCARARC